MLNQSEPSTTDPTISAPIDVAQDMDGTASQIELLTFSMAEQSYGVDIMRVREIRGWTAPTVLPHAPDFMRGVINLRGTVLPILDLSARLIGDKTQANARHAIIVVEHEDQVIGLLVDAVSDILTLETAQLQDPPDMPGDRIQNTIEALAIVDEVMIRILNLERILAGGTEATTP